MVADEGIKSVNLYDIFANVVPGLSLIFGLIAPFEIIPLLRWVLGVKTSIDLGIAHLFLLIAAAFVLGQLLQAFGSRYDGDHGFRTFVRRIRNEDVRSRYEMTEFDNLFWILCQERFVLTEDFDSYDRLFKAILSFLEASERTRALRMQALYLFARGVFVAAVFLTLFYSVIFYSLQYNYLPQDAVNALRSQLTVGIGAVLAGLIAYITYRERRELEADWIEYTLTEFYLVLVDEQR